VIIDFRSQLRTKFAAPNLETVIVLDSCEKIQRMTGQDQGLPSFRQLFIESSTFITELESHFIVTMPINAARACFDSLLARYSSNLVTVPSVKVTERDGKTAYPDGREVLQALVSSRTAEKDWRPYFSENALDFLIHYSGGYVRGFMQAVIGACSHAKLAGNQLPIHIEPARRAFNSFVQNASAAITPEKWAILAELDDRPTRTIDLANPDVQDLLAENLILEYVNGAQSKGLFDEDAPWYAPHPVLRELNVFKSTQQKLRESKNVMERH